MGTLEKSGRDSVSVKTADGKSVEVKLAATTVYIFRDGKTKEGTPAKVTDLAVGQRVIIHATPKGKDLIADEVKFAAAGRQRLRSRRRTRFCCVTPLPYVTSYVTT